MGKHGLTRWRTRDITVFTRLPGTGIPDAHRVLVRAVRCFGHLAVHPSLLETFTIGDPENVTTWEAHPTHPTATSRRWVITHRATGLRFSSGATGRGFIVKSNARKFMELIDKRFGEVLGSLPTTESPEDVIVALMEHDRYDDLLEAKRDLEKKYGGRKKVTEG